jgi:hypothetical protein
MSPSPAPTTHGGMEDNPYTRAFHREPVIKQSTQKEKDLQELACHTPHNRMRTTRQSNKLQCAKQHSLHKAVERVNGLNRGAAKFLAAATPTIGDLMEHTHQRHTRTTCIADKFVSTAKVLERAQANMEARESVRQEYSLMESNGVYGNIPVIKPDDSIWLMYENFSSLSVFSVGSMHHKKYGKLTS